MHEHTTQGRRVCCSTLGRNQLKISTTTQGFKVIKELEWEITLSHPSKSMSSYASLAQLTCHLQSRTWKTLGTATGRTNNLIMNYVLSCSMGVHVHAHKCEQVNTCMHTHWWIYMAACLICTLQWRPMVAIN